MKTSTNFPPSWDKRLKLNPHKPDLWDPSEYSGHQQMGVKRCNEGYRKIMQETTTSMLPKLIATIRWSVYGWPAKETADEMGLSGHGYTSLETDLAGRQPQFHTYERMLQHWAEYDIPVGVREQCLDLLTMPELFEQKNPRREEKYKPQKTLLTVINDVRRDATKSLDHTHMAQFYHRIGYDKGHATFEEKFPGVWGRLHTRGDIGTVPKAVELMEIIDTMYDGNSKAERQMHALRRAEAAQLWTEAKKHQYRERGIEEPMVELLVAMELDMAQNWEWHVQEGRKKTVEAMTLTAESIGTLYGINELPSQRLIQTEFADWDDISGAPEAVIDPKKIRRFEREWRAHYAADQDRYSFSNVAVAAMVEQGFSYKDLADLLDVKIQEDRRQKAEGERKNRDRPEAHVRNIIRYNRQSDQVAVEGLLRVLARDDDHYEELRALYDAERTRYYRRTGHRLDGDGLEMRLRREHANMPMKKLAPRFLRKGERTNSRAVRAKDIELQRLERNEKVGHQITYDDVGAVLAESIEEEAQKAEAALEKLNEFPEELREFTAVDQMAANCIQGMRGREYVTEAMRNIARHDTEWLREDVVQDIAEGNYVPPLPCLRIMAKAVTDQLLSDDVIRDWYERFPHQLMEGCPEFSHRFPFTQPFPRCVCTMIGSLDSSLIRFFNRVDGIPGTHGTERIRSVEREDYYEDDWKHMRKIVLATGVRKPQIPWQLAELLFHNGQNVEQAMAKLLPLLKKQKLEVHPQNLPGLTMDELEKYQR